MINGLEGIPGSGKSYEAVVYHVLRTLQQGRKVITNLPLFPAMFSAIDPSYGDLIELRHLASPVLGTWDATRVDADGNGSAFEVFPLGVSNAALFGEAEAAKQLPLFGGVWDYFTTWKHPITGQGPLFVIDECHVALPKIGTDPHVIEWYKLHRHFNVDVLLCTQGFREMSPPIAGLLAMLVKVRKADILGKPDHYIRKVHAGFRGAVISTEERKYKPEYFALYRSHSQGNSVAESAAGDVKPLIVKFKRFSRVFYVLTFLFCLYAASRYFNKPAVVPVSVAGRPAAGAVASAVGATAPVAAVDPAVLANTMQPYSESEIPEPYAANGLHLTGRMTMRGRVVYTFAVSAAGVRVSQVTSDDLLAIGYRWQPLTDCAGTLRWLKTAKAVTCNAPMVPEASHTDPVVIALPAGSVVPVARSDSVRMASK